MRRCASLSLGRDQQRWRKTGFKRAAFLLVIGASNEERFFFASLLDFFAGNTMPLRLASSRESDSRFFAAFFIARTIGRGTFCRGLFLPGSR